MSGKQSKPIRRRDVSVGDGSNTSSGTGKPKNVTQKRYSKAPSLTTLKQKGYVEYCMYPADDINRLNDKEAEIDPRYKAQCVVDAREGQYVFAKYEGVTRVTTMNVHNFVIMCEHFKPARNLELCLSFLKKTESDIVCLQEVSPIRKEGTDKTLTDPKDLQALNYDFVIQRMQEEGWTYSLLANNTGGRDYTINSLGCYYPLANAIFSRHPLVDKKVVILPGNRTVLLATVILDGVKTMICNTHLEYKKKDKDEPALKHEYGEGNILELQAKLALETIKREMSARKLESVVCCGDFNFNIRTAKHLSGFNKFFELGKQKEKTNIFFEDTKDYVLLNNSKEWTIIDNRPMTNAISDHFPVFVDMIPTDKLSGPVSQLALKKIKFQNEINIKQYGYIIPMIEEQSMGDRIDKFKNVSYYVSDKLIDAYNFTYPAWWASNDIKIPVATEPFDYHTTTQQMEMEFGAINPKRMQELTKLSKRLSGAPVNLMKELHDLPDEKRSDLEMDIDEIMLYYLKSRPNLKTVILWPACEWNKDKDKFRDTFRMLAANGNIFYSKRFLLNYYEAASLVFAVYSTTDRNKDMYNIDFNTGMKGWSKERSHEKRPVMVLFYEYTAGPQNQITGTQAFFKNQVRDIWKNDSIRIYDILHISDFFSEALDNCHLFLNRNSMRVLSSQNIIRFTKLINNELYVMINMLKSVMYSQFGLLDINRFNIISSFGLFTLGLRRPNDIDGHMLGHIDDCSPEFRKKYRDYFTAPGAHYMPFIDLAMPGTPLYADYMKIFFDKMAAVFGAPSYEEIILNPRYHQYFCGIKTPIIPIDLVKRIYRFKPRSLADIIGIDRILKIHVRLPSIPDKIDYYYRDDVNAGYIKRNVRNYLKSELGIKLTASEVDEYFTKYNSTRDIYTIDIPRDRYIFFKVCGFLMNYSEDFKHLIPKSIAEAGIRANELN